MRNIKLLIILLFPIYTFSQDIVYDVKTNDFEKKEIKDYKEGTVYLKNFNPFIYKVELKQNVVNNIDKLPKFLVSIPTQLFGISLSPETAGLTKRGGLSRVTSTLGEFYSTLKKYSDLFILIKGKTFDCDKVETHLNLITSKELIETFSKLSDNDREKIKISYQEIVNLEILITNIHAYYSKIKDDQCRVKIGKYKAIGEQITLQIILTPRENIEDFGNPISKITASKTIKTKTKKVRFSSGLMLSKNIKPDYFTDTNTDGEYQIYQESQEDYVPGITLLAHYELNEDIYINLGGGISIEGLPNLMVGGSYEIPKTNFFFNAGYSWAYTDTLSDKLNLDDTYSTKPDIELKKAFLSNFWFGFSYKL